MASGFRSLGWSVSVASFPFLLTAAETPLVQLFEVAAGINGDSKAQCVQVRFAGAAEARWGPPPGGAVGRAMLVFQDAAGIETGRYAFPADAPVGLPDGDGFHRVLIATRTFAETPGARAPDFILPEGLLAPGGGRVCFQGRLSIPVNLCLSYGDFAGDPGTDTLSPPNPAGPPAAAPPTTGVASLRRFQNLGIEHFGGRQFNADFRLGPLQAQNSAGETARIDEAPLAEQGRVLFSGETFGGNGRTCLTCHKPETAFGLFPETIAALPPDDPLFVAERVPALAGLEEPALLRGERALILVNIDGFDREPVFRGSPPLLNLKHTAPYGLSGEFPELREFTRLAVQQHFPRTLRRNMDPARGPLDFRRPTEGELEALEAFMNSLTTETNLDLMLASQALRHADQIAAIRRGHDLFFGDGKCFKCHSGPALSDVDPSLVREGIVEAPGNARFNTLVAGFIGPNPISETLREFSTRPLVGVTLRKRFFHDNSARDLNEVLNFYFGGDDERFDKSPAGLKIGHLKVVHEDLRAFLEALVEPEPSCRGGTDCNGDGVNDACEFLIFPERDCNRNATHDRCDIDRGSSPDCNRNDVPDECESPGVLDFTAGDGVRSLVFEGLDYGPGILPLSSAMQDLNGDGLDDLAIGLPEAAAGGRRMAGVVQVFFGGQAGVLTIHGPDGHAAGRRLASGDINGDGVDDLLIGADPPTSQQLLVVFGRRGLEDGETIDLSTLKPGDGFMIRAGRVLRIPASMASGDLNADGIDDLLIGAARKVFVAYGGPALGASGELDLSTLNGPNGFTVHGAVGEVLGLGMACGDLDGDGLQDLAMVALQGSDSRSIYVLFNRPGLGDTGSIDGSAMVASSGFSVHVDLNSGTGWVLSMAEDLNGDGRDDLFFTAPFQTPIGGYWDLYAAGLACVVLGSDRLAGRILSTYTLAQEGLGMVVHGTRANSFLGMSAAAGMDLNQDRIADIVLGSSTGEAYVLFGGPGLGARGEIDLASLDGLDGLRLRRTASDGKSALLGLSSTSLGDMDGDGFADLALVVGRPDPFGEVTPGRAHLLLGPLQGADCDRNGIPDECDIASGAASDVNQNGVPDSCEPRRPFHRGDPDQSGEMDLSDAISVLDHLFAGGETLSCLESADTGNDGRIDISDAISILGFLFLGGVPPTDPGPTTSPCALDPDPRGSPGDLGCVEYLPCARPPR